ncbi:response regulator [Imhoffiella purpurea]|uniref:histidine kinase n=1 Tax=Imhoffiella purpurea TaxID=1249627 RepID=W9V7P7_9GAMM|nr:response regulator [Imhoffiella purpurea]EXJ15608.1 signal transduction histidine kinase [Imhoffiella purpurea]
MKTHDFRPIRGPLLLLLCLALAIFMGLNIVTTIWIQRHEANEEAVRDRRSFESLFEEMLTQEAGDLSGQLDFIEDGRNLAEAFLARDRGRLLTLAEPLYARLNRRFDVTHFYFHGPDQICFLRVHNPPRHGDLIGRWTMGNAAAKRQESFGIELGPLGIFTLRVVRPWIVEGRLIGYLELGKEIGHFTSLIKQILGMDFLVLIDKGKLDRDKWREGLQMLERSPLSPWESLEQKVVVEATLPEIPVALMDWLESWQRGEQPGVMIRIGQKTYHCTLVPLFDVARTRVGEVLLLTDQTEVLRDHFRSSAMFAAVLLAVGALLALVFGRILGRLEQRLGEFYGALATEVSERRQIQQALAHAKDELEHRVWERTRELAEANRGLREEVDHRKEMEQALIQAKLKAEAATEAKSRFLSSMSHELRTPMNAIIGIGEVLADTQVGREQAHFIRILQTAGDDLLNIINDILDISKIEAGYMHLKSIEFEMQQLAEETCDMLAIRAHTKGVELALRLDPRLPRRLIGDPYRLRQILVNLIGNAIKFTERGYVSVEISPKGGHADMAPGEETEILFAVRDTGIGIPPERREEIFESFTQVDSSSTRKFGGTGLGLNISRRLANLIGGTIEMESALGFGSLFSVRLPFRIGSIESQAASPSEPPRLSVRRTLIVDDIHVNRLILGEMLHEWGADFAEAENAQEALNAIRSARKDGHPFDLLLVDDWMPEMDGLELADRIGRDPASADIAVVILSSDYQIRDEIRRRGTRLAGYLVKPVKKRDLERLLTGLTHHPDTGWDTRDPVRPMIADALQRLPAARVLVVEDSPQNRTVVQAYLDQTRLRADYAENGAEGIDKWSSRPYDLILMDMQMPIMDGYQATAAIREQERVQGRTPIPIVALTAVALSEEVEKCLAAGCTAHLAKPVRKQTFFRMLLDQLGTSDRILDDRDETPSSNSTGEDEGEQTAYAEPELLPFAQEFVDAQRETLERLRELLDRGRFEDIRHLGHTLKGEGGGYGLEEVSIVGAAIQQAADQGDTEEIARLIDRLTRYLDRVRILPKS